jgi:RND family efflux transporter MFP subunit
MPSLLWSLLKNPKQKISSFSVSLHVLFRRSFSGRHGSVSSLHKRSICRNVSLWLGVIGFLCGCSNSKQPSSSAARVFAVHATPVVRALAPVSLKVTGNLVEEQSSPVIVVSGGRVLSARFPVGALVHQGAILLEISSAEYQARLQQAKANEIQAGLNLQDAQSRLFQQPGKPFDPELQPAVVTAKQQYEASQEQNQLAVNNLARYQQLLKTGDVSQSSLDSIQQQATTAKSSMISAFIHLEGEKRAAQNSLQNLEATRSNYKALQAATEVAQQNLDACQLRSPITGFVSSRQYAAGDYAATGSTAATIIKVNPVVLNAQVPEGQEQKIKPGLAAVVRVPSYPDKVFSGKIDGINPMLDSATRALVARIAIPNPDNQLRAGMYASAEIQLSQEETTLSVPASAVVPGINDASPIVFIVDGNVARARVVRLGQEERGQRRVYTGLTAQDRVIVTGAHDLFDGASIRLE